MRDEHTPRAEAARRTAAIAALCGLALDWLVALPYARVQGVQIAVLLGAAICAALRLAAALSVADGGSGRAAWRGAVALGVVAGSGWLVTRAAGGPGGGGGAGGGAGGGGPAGGGAAGGGGGPGGGGGGGPGGAAGVGGAGGGGAVAPAPGPRGGVAANRVGSWAGPHHGTAA